MPWEYTHDVDHEGKHSFMGYLTGTSKDAVLATPRFGPPYRMVRTQFVIGKNGDWKYEVWWEEDTTKK